MIRKHVDQFIAERCGTTGFQDHDRRSCINFRSEDSENRFEVPLRHLKKTEVIQWAAAAHGLQRHIDIKPRVLENIDCRLSDFRIEVVREGVRPENYASRCGPALLSSSPPSPDPCLERLGRKLRNLP